MKDKIIRTFANFYETIIALLPNLLVAFFFILFFAITGYFVIRIIEKAIKNRVEDTIVVSFTKKVIKWIFYLLGFITALHILGFTGVANSILAGAGISAIVLGFAFKDIAENFLAGFLLAVSRPFRLGNIIEVNGVKGTVKELGLRSTHIRNIEGKDIYIPNAIIIKTTLINYTKDGLLRLDFLLGLDVPTSIDQARNLILGFLRQQPDVLKNPAPDVMIEEVGEFTVNIKVLFWVDILKNKAVPPSYLGQTIRSRLIGKVKDLLLSNGFNLPSPIREHKVYKDAFPIVSKGFGNLLSHKKDKNLNKETNDKNQPLI